MTALRPALPDARILVAAAALGAALALVRRRVCDLAAGTLSAEALLVSRFADRLADAGVRLPAAPIPNC